MTTGRGHAGPCCHGAVKAFFATSVTCPLIVGQLVVAKLTANLCKIQVRKFLRGVPLRLSISPRQGTEGVFNVTFVDPIAQHGAVGVLSINSRHAADQLTY